jgi:tRNA(Ile)-lysidine synthase
MIKKIQKYIDDRSLLLKGDKVLLAVSGGKDSVCMAHLFSQLGFDFCIAHCNFKLRSRESDGDALFVQELAKNLQVPFYGEEFDASAFAEKHKVSIQMAARQLRYNWFEELRVEKNITAIATAHHEDDSIETLLIKKSRKSSLEALRGILPKNGNIIRPILAFSSQEVAKYVADNNIKFREDSSNKSFKYQRNQLRLNIIPKMVKEDATIKETLLNEIATNVLKYEDLLKQVEMVVETSVLKNDHGFLLKLDQIQSLENRNEILYEIFKGYGPFNWIDLFHLPSAVNSKNVSNSSYRIIKERSGLILTDNNIKTEKGVDISSVASEIKTPIGLRFTLVDRSEMSLKKDSKIAYFDFNSLIFPLHLRKWQKGDFFRPFGMKGSKNVSDYMLDEKFSLIEKENTWVLCSKEKIVWLVGHRISEDVKLVAETEKVYLVEAF